MTYTSETAGRPWTNDDDAFLIFYGHCMNLSLGGAPRGYEYVARHDLHREPADAIARAHMLHTERKEWAAGLERDAEEDWP